MAIIKYMILFFTKKKRNKEIRDGVKAIAHIGKDRIQIQIWK